MAAIEQPSLPEGIARRIKYIREFMRGWTQAHLAKETSLAGLAIPLYTLKRIEAGTRTPTFGELWIIAKALNVKVRDLDVDETDYPELAFWNDAEMRNHIGPKISEGRNLRRLAIVPE